MADNPYESGAEPQAANVIEADQDWHVGGGGSAPEPETETQAVPPAGPLPGHEDQAAPAPADRPVETETRPDEGWGITMDEEVEEEPAEPQPARPGPADDEGGEQEPSAQPVAEQQPFDETGFWFARYQEREQQLRAMQAAMMQPRPGLDASTQGQMPMGMAVPPQAAAPAVAPAGQPQSAPPSIEILAERMGSLPTDPSVVELHNTLVLNHQMAQKLALLDQQIEPVVRSVRARQAEDELYKHFHDEFLMNSAKVPEQSRDQVYQMYHDLRDMLVSKRASTWDDALALYQADLARTPQAAHARGYEQGLREGATARTQRQRRGQVASATAMSRPSRVKTELPTPRTIDEAYRQAKQIMGR